MVQLTFIFKLDKNQTVYYGKIILRNTSNEDMIDFHCKEIIKNVINYYLKSINMPQLRWISIGIIGTIHENYQIIEEESSGIFNLYIVYDELNKNNCTYTCCNINACVYHFKKIFELPTNLQLNDDERTTKPYTLTFHDF